MSTSVILSRHRASLVLLPAAGPRLDRAAVSEVLERHGLRLLPGSDLDQAHEVIAAEGLSRRDAAALAGDLRELGAHVRVVNKTGLTQSRRIANAVVAQVMIGFVGISSLALAGLPLIDAAKDGASLAMPAAWIGVGVGALILAWVALNALVLQRGGGGLSVVGASSSSPDQLLLTDQLADLTRDLPEHVSEPLLERARRLEVHARQDPEGQAAIELQDLIDELRQARDGQAADEARELREDVLRARRALAETRGKG